MYRYLAAILVLNLCLCLLPVAQRTTLAESTREEIFCRDLLRCTVQLLRLHRRGRIPAQGGRSRRQEGAEVKAYILNRLCGCAGPTSVAQLDVLVQCDEGREAKLVNKELTARRYDM